MPAGAEFPFDFGFIPGTLAGDGDPLDILVLMDEVSFAGCVVPARLIGVIEAEQEEDGKPVRNDRLIAVAAESHDHHDVRSLDQLGDNVLKEIEHFFVSYHSLQGKPFTPKGRSGSEQAYTLVEQAMERRRARGARKQ